MMKETSLDISTGKVTERELTAEEAATLQAEWEANRAAMRKPRELEAIKADLEKLSPDRLQLIALHKLALDIQASPRLAIDAGVNVPGDEPA